MRSQQLKRNSLTSLRVPYRNSCLTMLLRNSFELEDTKSRARTILIVTASPGAADTEHTLDTLRNACLMAGLEATAATVSQTEVQLSNCGERLCKN